LALNCLSAGVATPSEVIAARALGICVMKLFPAEALGGVGCSGRWRRCFPGVVFCPTGGIDEAKRADILARPNVPSRRFQDGAEEGEGRAAIGGGAGASPAERAAAIGPPRSA